MKKLLSLILILIVFLLTSCAPTQPAGAPTQPAEEELTVDNLSNYLEFKYQFENPTIEKYSYFYFYHTDFSFKYYAVRGGSFNNVEIKVEIALSDQWFVEGTEDEDGVFAQKIVTTIKLPATGSYESPVYKLFAEQNVYPKEEPSPVKEVKSYKILSVSGTFSEN